MSEREDKLQAKIRKLLALAERGVGGEKDNARRMLDKLLDRHGMTLDSLMAEKVERRWFPSPGRFDRRLAAQIMCKICDTSDPEVYTSRLKPKQVCIEGTPADLIEFEIHYHLLRKALADHLDDAFGAFVQANRLYRRTRESDIDDDKLTDRDMTVIAMASAITPVTVNPQLERKP